MSKRTDIQAVMPASLFSRHPQFTFNELSPIHHILEQHDHSIDYIRTQDVFCLADTTERLRKFISFNQSAFRLFVQMIGQHFEGSPNEKKTQIPLMILTETESIFMRRIRRMKKAQKEQYSSYQSSTSSISFSKSYMGQSSCEYLESRLSQKDISQLTEFKSSFLQLGSSHQVFDPQFSSEEIQLQKLRKRASQSFGQRLLQSGIKRYTLQDQRQEELIHSIKRAKQKQVEHLIVGQLSAIEESQSAYTFRQNLLSFGWDPAVNPEITTASSGNAQKRNLPSEIRNKVNKQLIRYNVFMPIDSMSISSAGFQLSRKKKVRQKAEELLSSMGQFR